MSEMAPEVSVVYDELKEEINWLHVRWKIYRQLYAENPRRVEMLNECAAAFFYVIERTLRDDIFIAIGRLTDPAGMRNFSNLSLQKLQEKIDLHCDGKFSANSKQLMNEVINKCAPIRMVRDKKLAHLDFNIAMNVESSPLPGVSRAVIADALNSIREYMNNIDGHFNDSYHAYEMVHMITDGNALIEILKSGMRYEELRISGKLPIDDWSFGEWKDA